MNRSGTVADKAYSILRERILSGVYLPNEKLNERVISEELNLSRTPIREAIRRLELEKLVTSTPYYGTIVSEVSLDDAANIYELHAMLEGLACRNAAANITVQELSELEANIHHSEQLLQQAQFDVQKVIALNKEFHAIIYRCSGNPYIIESVSNLQNKISVLRVTTLSDMDRIKDNLREHWTIFHALRTGDSRLAKALGISHINNASKVALRLLEMKQQLSLVRQE